MMSAAVFAFFAGAALVGAAVALVGVWVAARLAAPPRAAVQGARGGAGGTLVDTSAIIDGRITEITAAGFLDGPLVVPGFVVRELQRLADTGDPLRRNRGRRGFEVLARLRETPGLVLEMDDADVPEATEVDDKLVRRARARGARVLTTDYNLNRVAALHGIRVLNVNDLAGALRPALLPGEPLALTVGREGKEAGQGVGFLDDGTMVIVEQGKRFIGQAVDVVVTSVLQTSAGRMVFTRLRDETTRDA